MRTKDQGTLDAILKFVNRYYQKNRVAPTITDVAEGVGVARSTTHRYLQELSERGILELQQRYPLCSRECQNEDSLRFRPTCRLHSVRLP
jgi:response regulator of citrate/malate metabolism